MNYTSWARKNKQVVIGRIVSRFETEPQDDPLAIFAAGIPGAGKTEFFDRLFENHKNFVRIDLDEIVKEFPEYKPENYYQYRKAANLILDELFRYCRHNKLDFALDGTFAHNRTLENMQKSLKTHSTYIYYLRQDPERAWEYTKDRELVEKRGISRSGFIHACLHIPQNLKAIRKVSSHVPIIAIKRRDDNTGFDFVRNLSKIDEILEKTYTKDKIERIIPYESDTQSANKDDYEESKERP